MSLYIIYIYNVHIIIYCYTYILFYIHTKKLAIQRLASGEAFVIYYLGLCFSLISFHLETNVSLTLYATVNVH